MWQHNYSWYWRPSIIDPFTLDSEKNNLKCIKLYILQKIEKESDSIKMCCINIYLTLLIHLLSTNTAYANYCTWILE